MKASAALHVDGVRCSVLRSDPPLTFRETIDGLVWIGSAAGPVGGDDLSLDVTVGAGAVLSLTSVAASMAYPGSAGEPSFTRIGVHVGPGGVLRWQPQPTVLIRGCDHRCDVTVELAAGSKLVWREEVVLGRHDEAPGSLRQRLAVELDGAPLLRTELAVGPRWPGSLGPSGTAGAGAVGTLLVAGGAVAVGAVDGVRLAVQPLAGDAVLVTALAGRAAELTAAFDALLDSVEVE